MLLALDTSGSACSAALCKGGVIIASRSDEIGRGHAEYLMGMLEELLEQNHLKWSDITKLASCTGPGSFTGLRVGLAAAKGLALALSCPCVGVSAFKAFAASNKGPAAVIQDAGRGEFWVQLFDVDQNPHPAFACQRQEIAAHLPSWVEWVTGSACGQEEIQALDLKIDDQGKSPPIEAIAVMGETLSQEEAQPRAFYLRAPDAKPQAQLSA